MRARIPLAALLLALPTLAAAEGAVRVLECSVTRICDAAGDCREGSGELSFRLAPEDTEDDGSGAYEISYGDKRFPMRALSFAGPFFWTEGSERHSLIANSQSYFLWHRLRLEASPRADIRFLACSLQQ